MAQLSDGQSPVARRHELVRRNKKPGVQVQMRSLRSLFVVTAVKANTDRRMKCVNASARAGMLQSPLSSNTTVLQIPDAASEAFLTSTLYELEIATDTRLAVQPAAADGASGVERRTVTITGDEDARQRCAQLILTRVFSRHLLASACAPAATPPPASPYGYASMDTAPSESQTMKLDIPNDATVNFVIGAKGASIMAMQDETGCHVAVAKASELPPGATARPVVISGGTEQQRERCAALVRAKVAEYQQLEQVRGCVRLPRLACTGRTD
jgi:hypothetical protein